MRRSYKEDFDLDFEENDEHKDPYIEWDMDRPEDGSDEDPFEDWGND